MKIIAAHQPTYLPDFEIFHKMAVADVLILADDFQFSRHNTINRNRIKTFSGTQWLTIPVLTKGLTKPQINDIHINNSDINWRHRHWRSLEVNYSKAAYFLKYADEFERLYRLQWNKLLELNIALIQILTKFLHLETKLEFRSALKVKEDSDDDFASLTRILGGDIYFVGNSKNLRFVDYHLFKTKDIQLLSTDSNLPKYHQLFGDFTSKLCFCDFLFNEGDDYFRQLIESTSDKMMIVTDDGGNR